MKRILFTLLLLGSFQLGFAQDCDAYYNFTKGTILELSTYDKKDRLVNNTKTEVISNEATPSGGIIAEFQSTISDKDKEVINTGVYSVTCEDGLYKVDVSSMINQDILKNYQGMEIEVEGNPVVLPNEVTAGQKLDDVTAKIHVRSNGVKIVTLTVDFVDRMVKGIEKVSTEAGEFECAIISFTSKSKMGFIKTETKQEDSYARNIGLVRSIVRNKKGKITGTTILTKYITP